MKFNTISEIYDTNDVIREQFSSVIGTITDAEAESLPEGEKWTIAQIVEHVAMVEDSMARVCSKLLSKANAAGMSSNGSAALSDEFVRKAMDYVHMKVEAPAVVQPTGERPIAESLAKMQESRRQIDEIRPLFESTSGTEFKFPHPYLGEMSAQEWLALLGGHEMRHLKQIERILESVRK